MKFSGLAVDIILCSPFWRLCGNLKSPKIKSISQIYNTKTFQIDLSHIPLKILHFFRVRNFPKCISTRKLCFGNINQNLIRQIQFEYYKAIGNLASG